MALEYASLLICDAHSVRCTCGKYWKAICGKKRQFVQKIDFSGQQDAKSQKE